MQVNYLNNESVINVINKLASAEPENLRELAKTRLTNVALYLLKANEHPEEAFEQLKEAAKRVTVLDAFLRLEVPTGEEEASIPHYFGKIKKSYCPALFFTPEGRAYVVGDRMLGKGNYCKALPASSLIKGEEKVIIYKAKDSGEGKEIKSIENHFTQLHKLNREKVDNIPALPKAQVIRTLSKEGADKVVSLIERYDGSAEDLLNKPKIPCMQLVHIARSVSAALQRIHALNLVHKDVKPENIYFNGNPKSKKDLVKIVLSDFGFTGKANAKLCGTEAYFSPELYKRYYDIDYPLNGVDTACEKWALGCTIYELAKFGKRKKTDPVFGRFNSDDEIAKQLIRAKKSVARKRRLSLINKVGRIMLLDIAQGLMRYNPSERTGLAELDAKFAEIEAVCKLGKSELTKKLRQIRPH